MYALRKRPPKRIAFYHTVALYEKRQQRCGQLCTPINNHTLNYFHEHYFTTTGGWGDTLKKIRNQY